MFWAVARVCLHASVGMSARVCCTFSHARPNDVSNARARLWVCVCVFLCVCAPSSLQYTFDHRITFALARSNLCKSLCYTMRSFVFAFARKLI